MEATSDDSKRPACDNCKNRKTKCNRDSPCSSCLAAKLHCRITRRAPEKRQRVLISTRYDEAMENVDRSLQEVSRALQKLLHISEKPQQSPKTPAATFVTNRLANISDTSEGYSGDSSFKSHVQQITDALRDAAFKLEFGMTDPSFSTAMGATQKIKEAANSRETVTDFDRHSSLSPQAQYPELQGKSLPPLDHVLKLLRLAQTEKQSFFVDVPVIDEQEFGNLCQKVYFAINDYSILEWIIANTGLFYLFLGLEEHNYAQTGVTFSKIQTHLLLLTANIEAAIQSLRLCQEPSIQACQALAVLATFCNKSGRSAVAWSLISAASRMCIDLGWHRLPNSKQGTDISQERKLFWHVYVMDKTMAFTFGRTPTIHQYDVATELPPVPKELLGAPGYIYAGYIEFAVIIGEVHVQLFSAVAQQKTQQARVECAKSFASRLVRSNNELNQSLRHEPLTDKRFQNAHVLLDIIVHCLVTIVYRVIPCDKPDSHPLQCNDDCIEAARQALSLIVRVGETRDRGHPMRWTMFLNMLLSLVPFACFVVLAGNTVASSSTEDLALLSATLSAIEPVASSAISRRKLYNVCKTFHQLASTSVARKAAVLRDPPSTTNENSIFIYPSEGDLATQLDNQHTLPYDIMTPQEWDTVMYELELGIPVGEMSSFVEPYMPFSRSVP